MVIDFHTHFYPEKIRARAMTAPTGKLIPALDGSRAALEGSMQTSGISLSVGLPLVNSAGHAQHIMEWARQENHDAICMLGSIHPADPAWKERLDRIADQGFPGIKVHPEYQAFQFDQEEYFPVWERCEELGLFVITHAGWDVCFPAPYRTDPEKLAAFHRRFPGLKLVLAHFGSLKMWDDVEKYLAGLPVWFDTAFVDETLITPEQMLRIIRKHGAEHILYGSDSPWFDQAKGLRFLRSLPLTEAERTAILYGNAAELLGSEVQQRGRQ